MKRAAVAVLLLSSLGLSTGCLSVNSLQRASTLGKGRWEIGLEPSLEGAGHKDEAVAVPRLDVSGRFGIADSVDLGFRAGMSGIELDSKFQLTPRDSSGAILSLAPSVGGLALGSSDSGIGSVFAHLPLLIGIPTRGGSELVIGPKISSWTLFADGGDLMSVRGTSILAGGTLGYWGQVSPSFALMPEVGFLVPVAVIEDGHTDSADELVVAFQASLGLVFGGGPP